MKERIKEVREYLGLTQTDVAHRLDVFPETVDGWENGDTLSGSEMCRFCGEFGVNYDWLESGTGEMFVWLKHIKLSDFTDEELIEELRSRNYSVFYNRGLTSDGSCSLLE